MELLSSQIQEIKKEIDAINKELVEFSKKDESIKLATAGELEDPRGYLEASKMLALLKRKLELKNTLVNSTEKNINDYNGEKIEIGTLFSAVLDFDGEIEDGEYILVSKIEGKSNIDVVTYVSTDSLFGKAVLGKKLMEPFYYKIGSEYAVGFVEYISSKEEFKTMQKTRK